MNRPTVVEACALAAKAIKPPKRTREGWCALLPGPEGEPNYVLAGSAIYGSILEQITRARVIYALGLITGLSYGDCQHLAYATGCAGDTRARVRAALEYKKETA